MLFWSERDGYRFRNAQRKYMLLVVRGPGWIAMSPARKDLVFVGVAPVDKVFAIAKEYFAAKPRAVAEKYFWRNSVAALLSSGTAGTSSSAPVARRFYHLATGAGPCYVNSFRRMIRPTSAPAA